MNRKLIVSIVMGMVSAIMLSMYVKQEKNAAQSELNPVPVAIANTNIKENTLLRPGMISIIRMPAKFVIAKAITDGDTLKGKVARVSMEKGDQVSQTKIMDIDNRKSTYLDIPLGMRAITITPDDGEAALALVKSGDSVDIVYEYDEDSELKAGTFEDTKIIRKESRQSENSSDISYSLTLLLDKAQAETIAKADQFGTVRMIHRPKDDQAKGNEPNKIITIAELKQSPTPKPPQSKNIKAVKTLPVKPIKHEHPPSIPDPSGHDNATIEVIRGFETDQVTITP